MIVLHLSDIYLSFIKKYNYLGITLDKNMCLSSLVSDVKTNISGHLFRLRKLRRPDTIECDSLFIFKRCLKNENNTYHVP